MCRCGGYDFKQFSPQKDIICRETDQWYEELSLE